MSCFQGITPYLRFEERQRLGIYDELLIGRRVSYPAGSERVALPEKGRYGFFLSAKRVKFSSKRSLTGLSQVE